MSTSDPIVVLQYGQSLEKLGLDIDLCVKTLITRVHIDQLGGCLSKVSILCHLVLGLRVGREVPRPVGTLFRLQVVLP